jgi:hypothetical protein
MNKSSRELDALVAEKVMGIRIEKYIRPPFGKKVTLIEGGMYEDFYPSYSTDIAAAWTIIEKLQDRQIRISNKALQGDYWWVYIDNECAQGSTLPEAICLSALKVVGVSL